MSAIAHEVDDVLGVTQEVLALRPGAAPVAAAVGHKQPEALVGERPLGLPLLHAARRRQRTLTHQLTALRNLVVLLHRMGAARETAELVGTVAGDALAPTYGDEAARLAAARRWACSVLGEDEAGRRAAMGASRSVDDATRVALSWLGLP